ncbi:MAG: PilZ domain-containing protein [Oscillospiraceae bacterium]|nr:PilZ domain-containing protein [Oscillospiraceae bacterium]
MKLFNLFGRKTDAPPQEIENNEDELEIYSGMRVEVTAMDGRMLFVAKLMGLHGNQAELHQYSEASISQEEPFPVRIRGYNDRDRKAVCMEGVIAPLPQNKCSVTELKVCRIGNDRAFFRLDTNLDATATMFSGLAMGEKPCKLLNISIGGAFIGSEYKYHDGDKFLLKVRLLEDRPESAMFSQVMRVIEKGEAGFEYGCRFLELTEADQEQITQNIFAAQRQKMGRS